MQATMAFGCPAISNQSPSVIKDRVLMDHPSTYKTNVTVPVQEVWRRVDPGFWTRGLCFMPQSQHKLILEFCNFF